MPTPFTPSPLAYATTAIIDRGQLDQPVSDRVLVGQRRSDPRNPLFKTEAEAPTAVAPFLRRNMEKPLPDRREYAVQAGGQTLYTSQQERDSLAARQSFPMMDQRSQAFDTANATRYRRRNQPRTGVPTLAFPTDADTNGHNKPINLNYGR